MCACVCVFAHVKMHEGRLCVHVCVEAEVANYVCLGHSRLSFLRQGLPDEVRAHGFKTASFPEYPMPTLTC